MNKDLENRKITAAQVEELNGLKSLLLMTRHGQIYAFISFVVKEVVEIKPKWHIFYNKLPRKIMVLDEMTFTFGKRLTASQTKPLLNDVATTIYAFRESRLRYVTMRNCLKKFE